jgi:hypothetical protein
MTSVRQPGSGGLIYVTGSGKKYPIHIKDDKSGAEFINVMEYMARGIESAPADL